MVESLKKFENEEYLNLETFKRDNQGVKTPVWFVTINDTIYVITKSKTGKVKRLKNNKKVNIVPCNFKGNPKGNWISAVAHFVTGDEADKAMKERKKKYGIKATLANMITKTKGEPIVIAISVQ